MEPQEDLLEVLTEKETNALIAWKWIDIVTYGLTLAFAVHNTYRFLCL